MALTDKQVKFIDEYMIDMNATAAYLRAGYKCSEPAARSSSSELLTNPNISEEIECRRKVMQDESGMSIKWVLDKYKTLIDDNLKMDPAVAKGALDSVGKHYGMFTDKIKLDVDGQVKTTHEYHIEQKITSDPDTAELIKQLYKRQAASSA